ncbi:MAG: UbiA family prenyltransferase [Burkholderiales bacterium]|nr:UbiA family prenyltransferase [Burkholderiales bacterium]MDE1926557.1 UbiA family prenyltransferase [Burkholderiales bacterium]MDE2501997.1 UbiA family prenyltransferase [Burkholderiales bacterium]
MNLSLALRLGRISNLPTVWTNVLVGALLAGAGLADARLAWLLPALSLYYVGGMFLNDAYDREFDAAHRPERPIPAGLVSARQVFGWGYAMLGVGLAAVACASRGADGLPAWRACAAGLALAAAIVAYDLHHKAFALSPLVMGLCRVFVVVTAAAVVAPTLPAPVLLAAGALLCHLIGLTYIAKQEHLDRLGSLWPLAFLAVPLLYGLWLAQTDGASRLTWLAWACYVATLTFALARLRRRWPGDVPRAVVTLIAGMSLLDAVLLAGAGRPLAAMLAIAAFALTLFLQRWISGT